MKEMVNKPSHYTTGSVMVADLCEMWGLDSYHQLCSAIEYIFRCNHKGTKLTDLQKACWWMKRHIDKRSDKYSPLNFAKMNKEYHPAVACKEHKLEQELTAVVNLILLNGKVESAHKLLVSYVEWLKDKESHSDDIS